MSAVEREWTLSATFRSDETTARVIKDAMETAALALIAPTEENTSKLFTLGAESVFRAAEAERASHFEAGAGG